MLAGFFLLIALAMSVALVPRSADAGPPSDLDRFKELLPEVFPEGEEIAGVVSSLGESLTFTPPLRNRGQLIAAIRADRRARGIQEEFEGLQVGFCLAPVDLGFQSTTSLGFGVAAQCFVEIPQSIHGLAVLKLGNLGLTSVQKNVTNTSFMSVSGTYSIAPVPLTYCVSAKVTVIFNSGIQVGLGGVCGISPALTEVPSE